MTPNKFTHDEALAIQAEHLETWRTVLTPFAYERLLKIRDQQNTPLPESPYEVWRGVDINNEVSTIAYKLRNL